MRANVSAAAKSALELNPWTNGGVGDFKATGVKETLKSGAGRCGNPRGRRKSRERSRDHRVEEYKRNDSMMVWRHTRGEARVCSARVGRPSVAAKSELHHGERFRSGDSVWIRVS